MSFPWIAEVDFEDATRGHYDAEVDYYANLGFDHYSELARWPSTEVPYRGAYCMRVRFDGTMTQAYIQETGSHDTNEASTLRVRFYFCVCGNPVMATNNEFAIFETWSGTNTSEAGVYVNYTTANGYRVGIGDTSASQFQGLELNKWHSMEVSIVPGEGGVGTIDAWLDGIAYTQVTATILTVTSTILGALGVDAGTTNGTVLFDQVVTDDARIYYHNFRKPLSIGITKSQHVFVGPGVLDSVELISGAATDNVVTVYDTDTGDTNDEHGFVLRLSNVTNSEVIPSGDISNRILHRGCYVALSGTNPRATVTIARCAPYLNSGALRAYGQKRKAFVPE